MSGVAKNIIAALGPDLWGHLAGLSQQDLSGEPDLRSNLGDILCFALNVSLEPELRWATGPPPIRGHQHAYTGMF